MDFIVYVRYTVIGFLSYPLVVDPATLSG